MNTLRVLYLLALSLNKMFYPEKIVEVTNPPPTEWTTPEQKQPVYYESPQISLTINSPCNLGSARDANGDCVQIF